MIQTARGVRDLLPAEAVRWERLEQAAREVFGQYGYGEIRTPIFEKTELFTRAVGETSDIVEKEMYTFADRGNESLTLRPEGTAAVVRSFINNNLQRQLPWRVFYIGPMFRYERPQKGRYRQFHQIGCELFGASGPLADAEMIAMIMRFLRRVGLGGSVQVELNSLGCGVCRPPYREGLREYLLGSRERLCPNCQQRLERNPLRVLDCKNPECREVARQAEPIQAHLCPECRDHFAGVHRYLEGLAVAVVVNPLLVRGLDYYTRTAFEVTTTLLGAQNAVAAGGRYDNLVAEMGGTPTPAIGFAMGVERLGLLLEQTELSTEARRGNFLAVNGVDAMAHALRIAELSRDAGVTVVMHPEKSLKSQMKLADRDGFSDCWIVGQVNGEMSVISRNMTSSEQEVYSMSEFMRKLEQARAASPGEFRIP